MIVYLPVSLKVTSSMCVCVWGCVHVHTWVDLCTCVHICMYTWGICYLLYCLSLSSHLHILLPPALSLSLPLSALNYLMALHQVIPYVY